MGYSSLRLLNGRQISGIAAEATVVPHSARDGPRRGCWPWRRDIGVGRARLRTGSWPEEVRRLLRRHIAGVAV